MSQSYVPARGIEDWRKLLADPEKQWKRGYSAMASALSWEAANGLPEEIAQLFLDAKPELLLAIPEHNVQLPGRGYASQCDVFALVSIDRKLCTISVEAKVNEPFDKTIGEWMHNASANKVERLRSLCEILNVHYPPPPDLRYQLFHRTAAAIIEATRFNTTSAAMVVHSFSQTHRWFEDFQAFCKFLGTEITVGEGQEIELQDGMRLTLGWATGSAEFT